MRTYHMLRELTREHSVTYLTFDDGQASPDAVARAKEYCTRLVRVPMETPPEGSFASHRGRARNLASPLPYAVWKYRSPAMQQKIEEIVRDEPIDILICDFLAPSVNV